MTDKELINEAIKAREKAYAPYSSFNVGAALLCKNGTVYHGCNIESAAYPATNCAERTAIFKAVSEGEREFVSIAVVGGLTDSELEFCSPCGICRQVMAEFCDTTEFNIIMMKINGEIIVKTLAELLPYSFGKSNLNKAEVIGIENV